MLNRVIRFSLNNQFLILAFAIGLIVYGFYQAERLPIEVLPDLSRPRVVVIAECAGMAPEEVETLVTMPIESYLIGATGITAIRSNSTAGLSMFTIEFDWNMDGFRCRQIVEERLQLSAALLPSGIVARMTPMASMMGQVMYLTLWDENDELSPMELRSLADWVIRKRLMGSGGISEILVMGGDVKQYQVQVRVDDLQRYDVTIKEVEEAINKSNRNVTGGFLTEQGSDELLVRSVGRIETLQDIEKIVVKGNVEPAVQLHQVADVRIGAAVKAGDSATFTKDKDGKIRGGAAVLMVIEKQAGQDTRKLSQTILNQVADIHKALVVQYSGLRIEPLYQQQTFIQLAVNNVVEALWLGALLVVIVLVLFLMNIRATFITVLAMPISLLITCIIFAWFGLTINTMTLGGLAVAIGELVDDAIVDVENIFRRLRQNFTKERPDKTINVVFRASKEIRNSIVFGTFVTVIVFIPVFFLTGMEGKLFAPLGIAYVVSLLASLLVSITVTPVLSYLLYSSYFKIPKIEHAISTSQNDSSRSNPVAQTNKNILPAIADKQHEKDGFILRTAKVLAEFAIRISLKFPKVILCGSMLLVIIAGVIFFTMQRDFVPPFNEGAPQVNITLPAGKSLASSREYATKICEQLLQIDGVCSVVRRTGRAELDEHPVPVNMSEMLCSLDLKSGRSIEDIFNDIEKVISAENNPALIAFYDQPLQHLIAHLRSGTRAKIALKIRGEDLAVLRKRALRIQELIANIPNLGVPRIDPVQVEIPQLRITLKRDELTRYGLTAEDVNGMLETALYGSVPTKILEGKRTIGVLVRLSDRYREDREVLRQLPIRLPVGGMIPLAAVAEIDPDSSSPSKIDHEAGVPQIVLQMNPRGRGAVDVKRDIDRVLIPFWSELTADNVHIEMTGLFQSEQESMQKIVLLSAVSFIGIFVVLFRMFGSANVVLQIMAAMPCALVGAVAAMVLTGQDRTIPNLVGMISLCGISARNGILLIDHYFHLVRYEGEAVSKELLIKAGKDRVAPVLMTALTATLGLLPLTFSPNTPGREILYPIATVIVGGMITSTLMEFLIRPALFWTFGQNTIKNIQQKTNQI